MRVAYRKAAAVRWQPGVEIDSKSAGGRTS